MTLADYLAKNYLTADPKPEKKAKKRKRKEEPAGLVIADEDDISNAVWKNNQHGTGGTEDDNGPLTLTSYKSAEFRRSKKSAWQQIGTSTPTSAEQLAADAILASVAAEQAARQAGAALEDAPAIVDDKASDKTQAKLASGAHAGLQSAAAVTAQLEARRREDKARFEAEFQSQADTGIPAKHTETIYRDASGRIINVAMKRAEARKEAEAAAAKIKADEVAQLGDVQVAERQARAAKLRDAKYMTLARGADDVEMNEELKLRERWNDPMAQFASEHDEKSTGQGKQRRGPRKGKSISGRPLYKGAAPPNRYTIRPGHRWDGVDRANGFEKKWFAARNRRENLKNLDYQWQMDE